MGRLRAASCQQNSEAHECRSIEKDLTENERRPRTVALKHARASRARSAGNPGASPRTIRLEMTGKDRDRNDEATDSPPFAVHDRGGRERRRQEQVDSFAAGALFFGPGEAGLNRQRQGTDSELVTGGPGEHGCTPGPTQYAPRTEYRGDGRTQDIEDPEGLQAQGRRERAAIRARGRDCRRAWGRGTRPGGGSMLAQSAASILGQLAGPRLLASQHGAAKRRGGDLEQGDREHRRLRPRNNAAFVRCGLG